MSDAIGDIEMRITGLRRQWILEMKNGDMDVKIVRIFHPVGQGAFYEVFLFRIT